MPHHQLEPGQHVTAPQPGPVTLTVDAGNAGRTRVVTQQGRDRAEFAIEVTTPSRIASDLVRRAEVRIDGNRITVKLPPMPPGASIVNGTIVEGGGAFSFGGGGVSFSGGSVFIGNGGSTTIVNGTTIIGGIMPISVTAILPPGSSLDVTGALEAKGDFAEITGQTSAHDITHEGTVDRFEASSSSGTIRVGQVGDVTAQASSGNVEVDWVTGRAQIGASSGDVRVHRVSGTASLRASSGDITVHGDDGVPVRATTSSGDVRYGSNLNATVNTSSGRKRAVDPLRYRSAPPPRAEDAGRVWVDSTTGAAHRAGGQSDAGSPRSIERPAPIALPAGPTPRQDPPNPPR